MDKKNAIVALLILCLTLIIFILLKINNQNIEVQKELLSNAEIILSDGQREIFLNENAFKNSAEETFNAVFDTSSTEPKIHSYVGVQLKNILKDNKIDITHKTAVIISAADGYSVAYSKEEVIADKNIYIVYMEDGKYLKSREGGGRGPYESIVVSDMFSNRRCKWITKIEVK